MGSVFQWTKAYSVQVQALDRQHQKLFDTVNELDEALSRGCGNAVVEDVLKRLVEYTVSHFAAEEKLMDSSGFPGLAAHRTKHQELTRKVGAFQQEYKAGNRNVPTALMLFLQNWLKDHILATDKKYSEFLNAKGIH